MNSCVLFSPGRVSLHVNTEDMLLFHHHSNNVSKCQQDITLQLTTILVIPINQLVGRFEEKKQTNKSYNLYVSTSMVYALSAVGVAPFFHVSVYPVCSVLLLNYEIHMDPTYL